MKEYGTHLILTGIACFIGGLVMFSWTFEEPLQGMDPEPVWRGPTISVFGLGLLICGIRAVRSGD